MKEVIDGAERLYQVRASEEVRLERLLSYRREGAPASGVFARLNGALPPGVPEEVRRLARVSRVNLIRYVVTSRVQDMIVDGFQTRQSGENVKAWEAWQANGMDARQMGVHRSALTFGASYVVVLPGKPVPVLRGVSPRDLTAAYAPGEDWPECALWKVGSGWRLLDDENVWTLDRVDGRFQVVGDPARHGAGVCPVVRFRDAEDLDVDVEGVVEPLIALQDQINVTSFGLHVAQHFGAFRQRYILGWLADSEAQAAEVGAGRIMTFEDGPGDVEVGEFAQTDLRGYIESREASIRHLATVSQTPVHELMGQFVNLSAEALEAARASHHAAVLENRTVAGEAWEQALRLASSLIGVTVDDSAEVVWRDTTMRSMAEIVGALGQLAQTLGVPRRALWARVPGVTQLELDQWEDATNRDSGLGDIMAVLNGGPGGTGAQD